MKLEQEKEDKKRLQEEMKRLREEELKKKSRRAGKKDTNEVTRKDSLLEEKQVCLRAPHQHNIFNNNNKVTTLSGLVSSASDVWQMSSCDSYRETLMDARETPSLNEGACK